jgi:S1-C subfamily serine protease
MKLINQMKACLLFAVVVIAGMMLPSNAIAQLPRDVQDMFEAMLPDLDDDLSEKFAKAIEDQTATVEFSAEQFLRFRRDPVNPFEGLDRIKVEKGSGNIALKFELPSIRNRPVGRLERQDSQLLESLTPAITSVVPSVVAVMSNNRQVALGTVVDENGFVVTKLSEVLKKKYLKLVTSDSRDHEANIVFEDEANDIAILKTDSRLSPIVWKEPVRIPAGSFLLMPAPNGKAFAMGTYSVGPRSTRTGKQARLGVNPDVVPGGVFVDEILPGTSAYKAGMQNGDVITSIDSKPIVDVSALVNAIRERSPGDKIAIEFKRRGVAMSTEAVLDSFNMSGERAKRYRMMSRLGAIPSRRGDDFPSVFQHDAPIFPEQCGGPVVDLAGNVVGVNIARNGRASTYAIPIEKVQKLVREHLRESVAERE